MYELALLAFIPLLGVIVRYRATYHPKAKVPAARLLSSSSSSLHSSGKTAAPSESDGSEPGVKRSNVTSKEYEKDGLVNIELETNEDPVPEPTPAPAPTFIGVWRNVWREEKIEGLFKGIFPGFLISFFIFLRGFVSPAPATFFRTNRTVIITNIFYLPYMVSTYRIIVTPHKLRLWEYKEMYRLLFSEYERQQPLLAICHSPVLLPYIVALFFDFVFVPAVRDSMGRFDSPIGDFDVEPNALWTDNVRKGLHHILWWEVARLALWPLFAVYCTLVMAPMDVVITRLAIQPVHGPPRSEERDVEKLVDTVAPPSYLKLTTEQRPYAGVVDCFKRIVEEEGYGALYRSWFLTFLGYLIPPLR